MNWLNINKLVNHKKRFYLVCYQIGGEREKKFFFTNCHEVKGKALFRFTLNFND